MGDLNSKPGRLHKVVWVTALAPPDAACEVRYVFCERPSSTFAQSEAGAGTSCAWYKTGTCMVKRKVV